MMKVEISGFYDEAFDDFDKQLEEVKKLGGHYLCPRNLSKRSIASFSAQEFEKDIKPRLDAAGISFSSIGSPIGKIPWDDDGAFLEQKKQLIELVKIAQLMHCAFIRVFAFYVPDKQKNKAYPKILEKFKKFLQIAHGSGVQLLLENEKKVYGSHPEEILRLYQDVADPSLALCFDASNYLQCGVVPLEAFHLLKDHISYIHIKDCSKWGVEVPFGTGSCNYPALFQELSDMNYQGFLTLEPHLFKYAVLKLPIYLVPFAPLLGIKMFKSFRLVDKAMHRGFFQKTSRPEAFEWQFRLVTNALKEKGE